MKVKELIEMLQKEDPTGETEVSIGNVSVWYVNREPAYWDGCLQVLKINPDEEHYNVIGAEFRDGGDKIVINALSIRSAIWNHPDMPITYDREYAKEHYESLVDGWREEATDFKSKKKDRIKKLEKFREKNKKKK